MFTVKGTGETEYFLGDDMALIKRPGNEKEVFTMGSKTFVKETLMEFEKLLGDEPPKKVRTPIDPKGHPELDGRE